MRRSTGGTKLRPHPVIQVRGYSSTASTSHEGPWQVASVTDEDLQKALEARSTPAVRDSVCGADAVQVLLTFTSCGEGAP